ncbi:MAG: helix-turn-helix domain-containing protein [Anaerolineae bacterium]|nr:helix-turn-helix domain-containing protein [Anaerolineae bacterium]
MNHPPAVCKKAQQLEQLLQRVEAGEPFESVRAALGLQVEEEQLPKLRRRYEAGGRRWEALIDGRYGHPQKAHSALREWLYEQKRADESLTAPELARKVWEQFGIELSAGHINYLLRKVELTRPPGRPQRSQGQEPSVGSAAPAPSQENAGLFFPRRRETGDGRGRGG